MDLITAVKKMKQIEKNIKDLKKAGYSVFCVDSEKLVLESEKLNVKNTEEFNEDTANGTFAYGSVCFTAPKQKYDYEINLL